MMKLSSVRSTKTDSFVYVPPEFVHSVVRVMVVVDEVSSHVIASVLRGLFRFSPHTRVLVTETDTLEDHMLGSQMATVDLDILPMRMYSNASESQMKSVTAATLISEVDACITVVTLDKLPPIEPPSLAMLQHVSPQPYSLSDLYFSVGKYFRGAVVDTGEQVIWGDDLLDVDATVYRMLKQPLPDEFSSIRKLAKQLDK